MLFNSQRCDGNKHEAVSRHNVEYLAIPENDKKQKG